MGTRDKTLLRRLERENEELKKKLEKASDDKELKEKVKRLEMKVATKENKIDELEKKIKDLGDVLTKSDLKAVLKERDEKTSGSKKDLVKRVKDGS